MSVTIPTTTPAAETYNLPPPTPPNTLPELIKVLSGPNDEARIGAARVLGSMGPEAEAAVPALTKALYTEGPYDVRQAAAWALGEIGPAAKSAVPALIVVLLTDFVHARRAAALALGKIGDTAAIPSLAQSLKDEDSGVSIQAAEAISMMTGEKFPDVGGTGYSLDENGVPQIVKAAREWWEQEGQYQDWLRH